MSTGDVLFSSLSIILFLLYYCCCCCRRCRMLPTAVPIIVITTIIILLLWLLLLMLLLLVTQCDRRWRVFDRCHLIPNNNNYIIVISIIILAPCIGSFRAAELLVSSITPSPVSTESVNVRLRQFSRVCHTTSQRKPFISRLTPTRMARSHWPHV